MKEYKKYEIIKELTDHNGNKNQASLQLGITVRQVNRLIKIYNEKGKSSFVHGNREHIPSKVLNKSIFQNIMLLYTTKYQNWNFRYFKEFLTEKENIDVSYVFIYKHLTKQGILSSIIHSWELFSFKKQLEKAHTNHVYA